MLYRCWPSEFSALPDLDANGNAVAIQTLVLQNEGWERDTSVVEPSEPRLLRRVSRSAHMPIGTFRSWPIEIRFGSMMICGLARTIRVNRAGSP